jgi:hypothetical protein
MKQEVVKMIRELVGGENLYFDTSLLIKITPHTWPVQIWAVSVSPKDEIYLMDGLEVWHQLEETDTNYHKVLSTLYQRLQAYHKNFKTA